MLIKVHPLHSSCSYFNNWFNFLLHVSSVLGSQYLHNPWYRSVFSIQCYWAVLIITEFPLFLLLLLRYKFSFDVLHCFLTVEDWEGYSFPRLLKSRIDLILYLFESYHFITRIKPLDDLYTFINFTLLIKSKIELVRSIGGIRFYEYEFF